MKIRPIGKSEFLTTYSIYKDCMFLPTEEKFLRKADSFFKDDSVKIFACLCGDVIKGIIALSFAEQKAAKIIGIAVESSSRRQGIGSYMIAQLKTRLELTKLYAETDGDAVEFYRKNGFSVIKFSADYNGEPVIRYRCRLAK